MTRLSAVLLLATSHLALTASANVEIRFVESAPKDRFVVTNQGDCELRGVLVEFDLSNTRGRLIFDTTASGEGVEVFQPFEVREGNLSLASGADVKDGDKRLAVRVDSLPARQQASFTIDVDDTLKDSALGQIRVTGSEMQDGAVALSGAGFEPLSATFDERSRALISADMCAV